MRSFIIILSVAVSLVLAIPSPNSDTQQEDVAAKDPRESIWRKMKVALPDGYYAGEEESTPQIAASEDDLLLPGRKPLYKPQQLKEVDEPAYKHLEITEHINITPLSPAEHARINKAKEVAEAIADSRRYKKLMGLDTQDMVENDIQQSEVAGTDLNGVQQKEVAGTDLNGVQQKEVAGIDLNGQMRYVDIPYYNRASS